VRSARWSEGPGRDWDLLVVDRIGILPGLYPWADVVVVGGSLASHGGHSPLEAAAAGRAIVMGPSCEHVRDAVDGLAEAGGIRLLPRTGAPGDHLCAVLVELLADPGLRARLGRGAGVFLASRRGAAERHARAILARLPAGLSRSSSNGRASTGTGPGAPRPSSPSTGS
jgi:3-deoxy-D-manno-octulosonic-acid transferase